MRDPDESLRAVLPSVRGRIVGATDVPSGIVSVGLLAEGEQDYILYGKPDKLRRSLETHVLNSPSHCSY